MSSKWFNIILTVPELLNNLNLGNIRAKRLLKNVPSTSLLLTASLGLIIAVSASSFVSAETGSVTVDGNSYDITYAVTGITVSGFEADLEFKSLIVSVNAPSSGTLDITLERNFFDSVSDGADAEFEVLVDGEATTFEETDTTSQYRILNIDVPEDTQDIDIIGSEFGRVLSTDENIDIPSPTVEEAPEPVEEAPEPVEEAPEPVEEAPEPVEEAPEPVEEAPEPVDVPSTNASGSALVYGVVGAFIIAGIVGAILGSIYKAGKRRNK